MGNSATRVSLTLIASMKPTAAVDITRASTAATSPMPQAIWMTLRSLLLCAIRSPVVHRSKKGWSMRSTWLNSRSRRDFSRMREKPMIR